MNPGGYMKAAYREVLIILIVAHGTLHDQQEGALILRRRCPVVAVIIDDQIDPFLVHAKPFAKTVFIIGVAYLGVIDDVPVGPGLLLHQFFAAVFHLADGIGASLHYVQIFSVAVHAREIWVSRGGICESRMVVIEGADGGRGGVEINLDQTATLDSIIQWRALPGRLPRAPGEDGVIVSTARQIGGQVVDRKICRFYAFWTVSEFASDDPAMV